jgi:hypothetical protein
LNSREATNTNFIVFDLTRLWLELTIYHTRGEHANHYTNDAVQRFYDLKTSLSDGGRRYSLRINKLLVNFVIHE